jgi:hypothetical protein
MARRAKAEANEAGPKKSELNKSDTNKSATSKSESKAPAPPPAEDTRTVEEIRHSIIRKLMLFVSDWRRCPRPACRRRRACAATGLDCASPRNPARPMTPDQETASRAHLKRALERRLAEFRKPQ